MFDLEQVRHARNPIHPAHVPPGFAYLLHRRHERAPDGRSGSAGTLITTDHAGTHIDALAHQAEHLLLHGGVDPKDVATSAGYKELGIDGVAPIVSRGILVDLAPGGVAEPDRWIGLDEFRAAAARAGVEPARGDVVLARTGFGGSWEDPDRYNRAPGMAGEVSQWLADAGVFAVGADNTAWDSTAGEDPQLGMSLPGHVILLVRAGIHIIEHLFLDELAAAGVHEFAFVCLPLKLRGATGSPVRPIAIV